MKLKYYLTLIIVSFFVFENIAQNITRGPYLQLGTPNSMIVRWRTSSSTDTKVWYGSSPNALISNMSNSGSTTEHEINITGLTPNTTYYYAVGNTAGQLAGADGEHYFKTSPVPGSSEPVSIWVLGDAGEDTDQQRSVRDAFYTYNNGSPHADLILQLGDNAYNAGTDRQYQTAWFENMFEASLVNSVVWPCPGNHDIESASSANETGPYYDMFNMPKNGEAGGVPSGTEAWYSFDYANIHFICLNTEDVDYSTSSPMLAWLKADIAATDQQWIVAYFHRHVYYNLPEFSQVFMPVLEAGGVDLVMYGHSHQYRRSVLMNGHYGSRSSFDETTMVINSGDGRPDGDGAYEKPSNQTPNAGTIYVLTGSAGSVSDVASERPFMPYRAGAPDGLGSLHVSVSGSQMDVKFINYQNSILDYFSISKGPATPPTHPSVNIESPPDGTSYSSPQTITITANASDPDGPINRVDFFANGASIGTDVSAPFSLNWNIPGEGSYDLQAVVTDADGNTAQSSIVNIQVGIISTCSSISTSSDDAEQAISGGGVALSSSDLELGADAALQWVGLRFQNLNIPENVQIVSAELQFTVDENTNISPSNFAIYGEKSVNPTTFSSTTNNLSNRARTQTSISWSPPEWTLVDQAGPDQSVDVSSVIQEIIDQNGYTGGSSIAILIEGAGKRVAQSFDKDPAKAAKLCIVYTAAEPVCEGLGDSDGDGVCDGVDVCDGGDDTVDTDGDLIPDFCDPCDNNLNGLDCNDNDPSTSNDVWDGDCNCVGTPCPTAGTACNDSDPTTENDQEDGFCNCAGTPCPAAGTVCDDGDPNTGYDQEDGFCNCAGIPCPTAGTACNDSDPTTENDQEDGSCNCAGTPCPTADTACDDGDPTTENDQEDGFCNCAGTPCPTVGTACNDGNPDTGYDQEDGFCNCAGIPCPSAGAACDDGDPTTENDQEDGSCNCAGTPCPSAGTVCDDGDPTTENDQEDGSCNCTGTPCPSAGTTCDDSNPNTYNDAADGFCNCAGTPCPEVGAACDDGNPNTINDVVGANCTCAGVLNTPIILNVQVTSSNDDVEERESDGRIYATSSDLELVNDGNKGNQTVGIRFNNISVPPGAAIEKAYVQFTADETFSATAMVLLEGEASNNASPFGSANYDVSARLRTTASANWNPPAWNTVGERDLNQRTTDISAIIQEIISRPGWTDGSSIVIIITGSGKRTAEAYDGSPAQAASLHIEYFEVTCDLTGTSCNDNDPCTTGDVYNASCNCVGVFQDSDNDGVCDNDDICPNGNDAIDSDSDGVPDACDDCQGADTGDSDGDGVCNSADLCPGYNDMADADGDGVPDACDLCDNTMIGMACDDGDPNTVSDVYNADCICAGFPNAPTILDVPVTNGNDDVEERETDGKIDFTSSDLELVNDGGDGDQTVGIRFNNISIPTGSAIQNAYIQFTADETASALTILLIEAEASDHAIPFANVNYNVSTRSRTNASVNWNPQPWLAKNVRSSEQQTADISPIIQEIINRPGWVNGNSVAIIITGTSKRTADSFDGAAAGQAASLHIEYFPANTSAQIKEAPITEQVGVSNLPPTPVFEANNSSIPTVGYGLVRELKVEVMPNPFRDEFHLFIQKPQPDVEEANVRILDINGRVVYEQEGVPFEENYKLVPQYGWPKGLYFVRVQAGPYMHMVKLVKQ